MSKKYLVIGGAGFIGSHMVKKLLCEESDSHVIIYDNFSSGKLWHIEEVADDRRLSVIKSDIKDIDALIETCRQNIEFVFVFASNPDISKAMTQPDIDFWEGTYLVNNILEAMRRTGQKNLLYASGSGVYGDVGLTETAEDFAPLLPISTYGASKLACEALICSYCHMFEMNAAVFRFANVVGPNQTHGVGYDFLRQLHKTPHDLTILGDGTQSKSYIHVDDVLEALRVIEKGCFAGFSYFNVATLDYVTVAEIADMACRIAGCDSVTYHYTGGERGWKGDVPVVRLNTEKIRTTGWSNKRTARQALQDSMMALERNIRIFER